MNDTRFNGTLLNRSVLNTTRLNATGIARKAKESVEDRVMKSLVLWYDLKKQGATNESMAADPRIIDHSGNGHHATCYNFAWAGMSGIGGYNFEDLDLWIKNSNVELNVVTSNKVTILNGNVDYKLGIRTNFSQNTFIKIKVEGSSTDNPLAVYKLGDADGDKRIQTITEDNVYTIGVEFVPNAPYQQIAFACNNITIEQLPLYPNALVSDGVDDCVRVTGLPIFTKEIGYTFIAKRKWLEYRDDFRDQFLAVKESTYFEYYNGEFNVVSFGEYNVFDDFPELFSYQTSKHYNSTPINSADSEDVEELDIFYGGSGSSCDARIALYSLLLFDRDLTAEEIGWVKTNMIGGEQ